jgi:hypothetical protein
MAIFFLRPLVRGRPVVLATGLRCDPQHPASRPARIPVTRALPDAIGFFRVYADRLRRKKPKRRVQGDLGVTLRPQWK